MSSITLGNESALLESRHNKISESLNKHPLGESGNGAAWKGPKNYREQVLNSVVSLKTLEPRHRERLFNVLGVRDYSASDMSEGDRQRVGDNQERERVLRSSLQIV